MAGGHGHHGHESFFPEGKHLRILMGSLIVFIVIVLLVILIVYLVLHPQKPRFNVHDATVLQLNLASEGSLTSSFQFSIESHNPNNNIGIYYDTLSAYASYDEQQITPPCSLTAFFQGDNDFNPLDSVVLSGNNVALAPSVAENLNNEKQSNSLSFTLKMSGRIRWKVGSWTSGHYRLNVNCFVPGMTNNGDGGQVSLQSSINCQVDIGG